LWPNKKAPHQNSAQSLSAGILAHCFLLWEQAGSNHPRHGRSYLNQVATGTNKKTAHKAVL